MTSSSTRIVALTVAWVPSPGLVTHFSAFGWYCFLLGNGGLNWMMNYCIWKIEVHRSGGCSESSDLSLKNWFLNFVWWIKICTGGISAMMFSWRGGVMFTTAIMGSVITIVTIGSATISWILGVLSPTVRLHIATTAMSISFTLQLFAVQPYLEYLACWAPL